MTIIIASILGIEETAKKRGVGEKPASFFIKTLVLCYALWYY